MLSRLILEASARIFGLFAIVPYKKYILQFRSINNLYHETTHFVNYLALVLSDCSAVFSEAHWRTHWLPCVKGGGLPHIAVTEALTLAFMLGIIRHNYFSVNIVLEIAGFRFYTCTVENEDGQRLEQRMIRHRRLNGCIGDFLYLKPLNNEYKLDIQQ